MVRDILDGKRLLEEFGSFHDARIEAVHWKGALLEVLVDDINSAFAQTEEYRGEIKGAIRFTGVTEVTFSVERSKFTSIYSVELDQASSGELMVSVALAPAGRLVVECAGFEVCPHEEAKPSR